MNCENVIERLDDWLDGELPPAEARALEAHAQVCDSCRHAMNVARRLQRQAFALPSRREPPRDLWPDIAQRLEPRGGGRVRPRQGWQALAAGVAAVAIFAGGMLASRVLQQQGVTVQPRQVVEAPARDALPSVDEARRVLPASYVELVEGATPGGLASGTEQALLRNLLVVNLAIREVEAAVAEHPGDADLRELLSGLYAEENRILAQAERLRTARQAPTRTAI